MRLLDVDTIEKAPLWGEARVWWLLLSPGSEAEWDQSGVPYIQAPHSDALGDGTFAHKQVLTTLTFTYFSFHDSVFVTQTPEQVGCDGGGKWAILIPEWEIHLQ